MKEDKLEKEKEEGVDVEGEETQEKVTQEADEGEMPMLRRDSSSQRSVKQAKREHLSLPMYRPGKNMFINYR